MAVKAKVKALFVAGRFFVLPWMAFNTLLPIYLAGFDLYLWLLAFAICSCVLVAGHFINNWRDFVRGVDKVEGGSVGKSYTRACEILPKGFLSVQTMYRSALVLLGFAFILMLFAPIRFEVALFFLIGVVASLTYTDIAKPHGYGEIYLFATHGVSVTLFSYALVKPLTLEAVGTAVLLGLWAALALTMDQYPDAKREGALGLVSLVFKANLKPSQYVWFAVSGVYTIQMGFTVMGILPAAMLLTVVLLPFIHLTTLILDTNFPKGMLMLLFSMFFFPLVATIGLILI